MTYQEVYDLINDVEGKNTNVWITSQNDKRYKQNLHISSANLLKIRNVSSKAEGYNVTPIIAEKWKQVDIIKPRKKKK